MKNTNNSKIIYSISRDDICVVANKVLERNLSEREKALIEQSVGDYIDWFQAIENAIYKNVKMS